MTYVTGGYEIADDAEHPELIYYENDKKNAVAPRVTDQASNKVAAQVNTTFAETISDVALGLIPRLGTSDSESLLSP